MTQKPRVLPFEGSGGNSRQAKVRRTPPDSAPVRGISVSDFGQAHKPGLTVTVHVSRPFGSDPAVVPSDMPRDALTPAKALADLIARGQIATALKQLRQTSPPKMQRATLKRLEPLLDEADRKWFRYQWMRRTGD